ncbi:hypothetical protein [Chamaesiphon sp. OTE_8_metabat_110]|uniref:hypothetical protein n=1 Tax=Chamaesiphon sp. OTE_8_metabat_110 TaxID=2964696 RepID=UPI00286A3FE2|nr:hypothetical protein [Chamaesiphon sp. OTE_8_metabat_110]
MYDIGLSANICFNFSRIIQWFLVSASKKVPPTGEIPARSIGDRGYGRQIRYHRSMGYALRSILL